MLLPTDKFGAWDGDDEIVYSNVFNIYENKLTLVMYGAIVNFNFLTDSSKQVGLVEFQNIPATQNTVLVVNVNLFNWRHLSGMSSTGKPLLISLPNEGKSIYFTLHVKALTEKLSALQVFITLYKK
jgi:hypothetical protein